MPDLIGFNLVLGAQKARNVWQEMLVTMTNGPQIDLLPDVVSYNTVLSCLATVATMNGLVWPCALSLLEVMVKTRVKMEMVTYNTLSKGLARAGRWQDVLESWRTCNS